MLGPKQQQLKAYIENANEDSLDSAGDQWRQGEQILRQLATELRSRGDNIGGDDRFTGDTATKTVQAFHHSSKKMQDRALDHQKIELRWKLEVDEVMGDT